ncbi:MAG: nuclear transport factor 2 family protein [Pseudomonadota bacterium]
MTHRLRFLAAGLAAIAFNTLPALASAHPDAPRAAEASAGSALTGAAAEAAQVVDAFHAALKAGDAAKAASLMADTAVIYEAGGVERSKADYAAGHLARDAAFLKTASASVERRTGGAHGDLAWVASEGRLKGEADGKAIDRITTETMILSKTPLGWRITHAHWSSRAASAAH